MKKTVKKWLAMSLVFCLVIASLAFDIVPGNLNSSNIVYADQPMPGVTVTASSSYASYTEPNETVDGIIADQLNCWASANDSNSKWIQYDFGSSQNITNAVLYFRNLGGNTFCVPKDITFQVSNDGNNWTTVISKSTNVPAENTDYSTWTPYTYTLNTSGRYLRLLFEDGGQNTTYNYVQLTEVYINNISMTAIATASSFIPPYTPNETVDGIIGDQGNLWASASNSNSEWIQYDFGSSQNITNAVLYFRNLSGNTFCVPQDITFQVSNDGNNWTTVISKSTNVPAENTDYSVWTPYTYTLNTSGRYLRLLFEDGGQNAKYKLYRTYTSLCIWL